MESSNFFIVFLSVFGTIGGIVFAVYKIFFENIKTENDSLKIELEKQKINFEKFKFEQEQKNREEDKKEEKYLRSLEHDKILFEKIIEVLPFNSSSITLVKDKSLNMFPSEDLNDFTKLLYNLKGSENSFLNIELEEKRKKLYTLIQKFITDISMKTYPHQNNSAYQCVPPEWEFTKSELYKETLATLNKQGTELFNVYDKFIKFSKEKLY